MRKALVVAQVALSVVLVSGATLFSRSLSALRNTDTGFHHFDLLSFRLDCPRSYRAEQIADLRKRLMERTRSIPGVSVVSYGFPGPYQGGKWSGDVSVPGAERALAGVSVAFQAGASRYFEAIGSLPVHGRDFRDTDTALSQKVAIVNQAFSREFLGGADPVGRSLRLGEGEGAPPIRIIGMVRDMRHGGVRERPAPTVYLSIAQGECNSEPLVFVRAAAGGDRLAPLLRRELAALDPTVTLSDIRTVRQAFDDSIYLDRLVASLSGLFAALSLVLAGVGLYGVLSYLVAQRTPEIGIRLALGAAPGAMLWLVLREGLLLVAIGDVLGVPIAMLGARLASGLLFGVAPADPYTFAASVCFLLLVGSIAAGLPGRRASSISPMQALRQE